MRKEKIRNLMDWLCHLIGYTLVLIITSLIFPKNLYVDNSHFFIWGFIAILIIYIFNKTIKPLLFWVTIPLTAITMGLFYPIINIFILKITDLLLGSHFQITGVFSLFFVSIIISLLNTIMDHFFVNKLLKGVRS